MRYLRIIALYVLFACLISSSAFAMHGAGGTTGGSPGTQCNGGTGDLGGTYPNCTVATVLGGSPIGTAALQNIPLLGSLGPWGITDFIQPHSLPTGAGPTTLTCQGTTGTVPYRDDYIGSLAGNSVIYKLPTSGCADGSIIEEDVTSDGSSHTVTNQTSASGGIQGTQIQIGTASGNYLSVAFKWQAAVSAWNVFNEGTYPITVFSVASGGTGAATLTGIVRGNGTASMTASELSGDATTSGSNVVSVVKVNGNAPTTAATTHQWVSSIDSSARGIKTQPSWGDLTASATFPLEDAPVWMHYLGDGSEADPALFVNASCVGSGNPVACCTGSGTGTCATTASLQGTHYYANFTVGASTTVTVTANSGTAPASPTAFPKGLIVISPGTCTIAGAVNGFATANGSGTGVGGGASGGSGFGAVNGSAGGSAQLWTPAQNQVYEAGGAAGTSGVAGGDCSATFPVQTEQFLIDFGFAEAATLGGNIGVQGGSSGGAGGQPGLGVILDCQTINYTGAIDLHGGAGGAGGVATGGGSGGGGGFLLEAAHTYTANSGTTTVTGGAGGAIGTSTSTKGGAGCNGWTKALTLN